MSSLFKYHKRRLGRGFRQFRRNGDGSVAIEFGMVFTPFLMLIFAILGVSLYYFTETALDQALATATRPVLTGKSRSGTSELTAKGLRDSICSGSAGLIDCAKLVVRIEDATSWDVVGQAAFKQKISCYSGTNDAMSGSTLQDSDNVSKAAGGESTIVVVVACYPWDLLAQLPYLSMGNVNGGSARLIQSTIAFKSEPYGMAAP